MGCGGSKSAPVKPMDDVYLRREQYDAIVSYQTKQIAALFKMLDVDKSGTLDKKELEKIVSRYQGAGTAKMERFMDFFDVHVKDERVDPKEFGWYLASVAKVMANEDDEKLEGAIANVVNIFSVVLVNMREEEEYDQIVAGVRPRALALFKHLDKDNSGGLSKVELRTIVQCFSREMGSAEAAGAQGSDISNDPNFLNDEAKFFEWFDVHTADGKGADGLIDFDDFRWFLAQSAKSVKGNPLDNIGRVIATFEKIAGAPHSAAVVHHQKRMTLA